MRVRIFIPPVERVDETTRLGWLLIDARGGVLREGTSTPAEIPRAGDVEAVLPASRVLFARLRLPRVSAATIRELLPYAVEDRLLADPSHIHAVAGPKLASGETLVAVIDRGWLRAMVSTLERAGLRSAHAWPESALFAPERGTWDLVWSATRGMLVDDEGMAATFDHDASGALPLALRLALDEGAARGEKPRTIRAHAEGDEALPPLARWASEAGISFEAAPPWSRIAPAQPGPSAIDLLQGEFRPGPSHGRVRNPRAALALAAAIATLQIGFTALEVWRLERERDALEQRREEIFRAAFPEAKAVVDPELQMRRNLAELRRTRGVAGGDEFLANLARVARESAGTIKALEYANGKLVIHRDRGALARTTEGSR